MARRRSATIKKGDLVDWDDRTCRVLKRRRVTGMAMFQTSDYEVYLETVEGDVVGWVGENEVGKTGEGASGL
jgi:hypothetical protein